MKVWELMGDGKTLVVMPKFYLDKAVSPPHVEIDSLNGEKILNWEPVEFYSSHRKKSKSDYIKFLLGSPILSWKARNVLEPYIANDVQFLPIIHELDLSLVNVVNVLDCVNYSRSKIRTGFQGVFVGFDSIGFNEDMLQDQFIFKIKEQVEHHVYVTDVFKDIVQQSKLKGFDFIEVWDSELTVEKEEEMKKQFEEKLKELNDASQLVLDWNAAHLLVEDDKAVASGAWKLQKNKKGTILLGKLSHDLTYDWIDPMYYPPVLLSLKWREIEKSDI